MVLIDFTANRKLKRKEFSVLLVAVHCGATLNDQPRSTCTTYVLRGVFLVGQSLSSEFCVQRDPVGTGWEYCPLYDGGIGTVVVAL